MALQSELFRGEPGLEACLVRDAAHIVLGATGSHVGKVQQALALLVGASIDPAELSAKRYGPSTVGAVLSYKQARGIINRSYQQQADNIVGKMTIATMDAELVDRSAPGDALKRGARGRGVADMQAALNYHLRAPAPPHTPFGPPRPRLVTDGVFGPLTEARVAEYQRLNDLPDTGTIDSDTRKALCTARRVVAKIPINRAQSAASGSHPGDAIFAARRLGPGIGGPPSRSGPLIAPVTLQNRQTQTGASLTLDPLIGPGEQSVARFLSVQWTWVEQRDGRHVELTSGGQFATALTRETFELSDSVQAFAQVTIADVVTIDPIHFHLFNPSAQISFQSNFTNSLLKSNAFALSAQNQITWDAERSGGNAVFSLFCQQQLAWTYDLATRKGAVAPAFLVGAIWTTNLF